MKTKEHVSFGEKILSLFIPKKMGRYKDLNFFISLLIILCASLINISTSNLHVEKDLKQAQYNPAIYSTVDLSIPNELNIKLENDNTITSNDGVFHQVFEDNGTYLDLTIVVTSTTETAGVDMSKELLILSFDIDGYFNQTKKDNTEYILYVMSKNAFFYSFNLDKDANGNYIKEAYKQSIYENTTENKNYNYTYYLPASNEELALNVYGDLDTTLWTRVCKSEDTIDFIIEKEEFKVISITPKMRFVKNFVNVFYGNSYNYKTLRDNKFDIELINGQINNFNEKFFPTIVSIDASYKKTSALIYSLILTLFFSLMLSTITWLLSKGFALKKFRQYYALCALCFAVISILDVILGIFLDYFTFSFISLIVASIYYIIVTYKVNAVMQDNTKDNDPTNHIKERVIDTPKSFSQDDDYAKIG